MNEVLSKRGPGAARLEALTMFKIVDEPIDATALGEMVRSDADGAVCVFLGVARKFSRGREVVHLEYEAYPRWPRRRWPRSATRSR